MAKQVLILCTGNSCRSQMAEAFWNQLSHGAWEAVSAGSRPSGHVHPLAIAVMAELGIDLSHARSKNFNEYQRESFDLVVTVCDNAKEACPRFAGSGETRHWPFRDPADATGTTEQKLVVFREVRDEIRERISQYLSGNQEN